MEQDIYSPNPDEFRDAFIAFMLTVSSVAFHRGCEFGPMRMAYIAQYLAHEFKDRFSVEDAAIVMEDIGADSELALGALFEEFVYIACKYKNSADMANIDITIPGNTSDFDEETGNAFSDEAIQDIETVNGSIGRLLAKLPKWAQRIVEAILEALKLTRGG
ncbi:hypothetical protein [Spiribacter vilamensis]|uniref:Uncharacterized protein n=1 Tax=Spiribacter vilamensis TaxID=531306 RepID=A0A4Q8CZT5_9GAMM|nr:hypothetical protein [Spiribacter vilamensis]RZU98548.1 hypothetical protein EV698_0796 [Spiribacter vilamensis]TVO60194.1 hypothetical protein FPL09_10215 [Spiribacter vilamensis]